MNKLSKLIKTFSIVLNGEVNAIWVLNMVKVDAGDGMGGVSG